MKQKTIQEGLIPKLIIPLVGFGLSWFPLFFSQTGSLNPKIHLQYLIALVKEDIQRNSKEYSELYKQILDLGDKDKNSYLNFAEQVDVWKRMGYQGPFIETEGAKQFPKPKLEDLEKALESYRK